MTTKPRSRRPRSKPADAAVEALNCRLGIVEAVAHQHLSRAAPFKPTSPAMRELKVFPEPSRPGPVVSPASPIGVKSYPSHCAPDA
jgi:hypothetical protein